MRGSGAVFFENFAQQIKSIINCRNKHKAAAKGEGGYFNRLTAHGIAEDY